MSFLNITLGQFYPAKSIIHRLDPRLKIISLAVLMLLTFTVSDPGAVFIHSAAVMVCVLFSGVPVKVFLKGLRIFFFLFLFTAILHLFFTPGAPLFTMPGPIPLRITEEGILRGALVSWRLLTVIGLSSILTYTTSPLCITKGLEAIMSPLSKFRFPVQDFSLMMMMAIRFIPILTSETDRVWKAQKSRGADLRRGGLKKRSATLMSIIIPVFTGLFRRADDLALALEARGYVPGRLRTHMHPLSWSFIDSMALIAMVVWSGILLAFLGAG